MYNVLNNNVYNSILFKLKVNQVRPTVLGTGLQAVNENCNKL